jgi:demethylmenaquinone methyltransferase/2-methoxy-6-polyprenyl-1,4-benzoquinol methylase/phosphoethanolamine N-methyltransferase
MHHQAAEETAPQTAGKTIRWAHWYNLLFARKPTREHKQAVRALALQPGEKALDVGCGPGTTAIFMAKEVGAEGEVVGIDASLEMIQVAREKAKKEGSTARFEPAAIEALPFPDETFDAATSTYMLHHLPEDVQAKGLSEVRRVLKPGGRFLIVDFSSESGSFLGHLLSILGHAHGHSSFPGVEAKLRAAGFTSIERLESKRKATMLIRASV